MEGNLLWFSILVGDRVVVLQTASYPYDPVSQIFTVKNEPEVSLPVRVASRYNPTPAGKILATGEHQHQHEKTYPAQVSLDHRTPPFLAIKRAKPSYKSEQILLPDCLTHEKWDRLLFKVFEKPSCRQFCLNRKVALPPFCRLAQVGGPRWIRESIRPRNRNGPPACRNPVLKPAPDRAHASYVNFAHLRTPRGGAIGAA